VVILLRAPRGFAIQRAFRDPMGATKQQAKTERKDSTVNNGLHQILLISQKNNTQT